MQSLTTPRALPEQRVPAHRFPDDLDAKLLSIALGELPKPLRRSQLGRRDYIPLPVTKIRRLWFRPVVSAVARCAILLGSLAIIVAAVAAMWAGTRWINEHSSGGTMLEPETILEVQERAFFQLPPLSPPWHWAMLPCSLTTDDQGRPSFFIRARDRGTVKSERDLAKTAEIGDQYTLAQGTTSWVWVLPTGAKAASWIDP
jgi:hypothetical protein